MTDNGHITTPAQTRPRESDSRSQGPPAQRRALTMPAVPMSLVAMTQDEESPVDDLLWDWARGERWPDFGLEERAEGELGQLLAEERPQSTPVSGSEGGAGATAEETRQELAAATQTRVTPAAPAVAAEEPAAPGGAREAPTEAAPATAGAEAPQLATAEPAESVTSLEGAGGLERWSGEVKGAANRIRAPSPADPEGIEVPLREPVDAVRRRESARRSGAARSVKAALPKAPELPEALPPPPPIPVPEAETAVAAAVGRKLPDQVLPKLQDYTHVPQTGPKAGKPQVVKAMVGLRLPPGSGAVLAPVPPPPKPAKEGRKKLAQVKAAGEQIPAAPAVAGSFTLSTAPAPGAPGARPGPPVSKADITGVLVRLRQSIPADADAMLTGVRTGLVPMGALQFEYPQLGNAELLPELNTTITQAIDMIATQAGIDLGTLHTATLTADGKVLEQRSQEHDTVTKAGGKARKDVEAEGKQSADTDAGAKAAAEDAIFAKVRAAEGGASPEQIRQYRDQLMQRVNRRLAPEDVRYEREGEERLRALGLMEIAYTGAYQQVARQVAERIRKDAEAEAAKALKRSAAAAPRRPAAPPPTAVPAPAPQARAVPPPAPVPLAVPFRTPPAPLMFAPPMGGLMYQTPAPAPLPVITPATPAEQWTMDRTREVRETFKVLREEAQRWIKANRDAVSAARATASVQLHAWSDREIGDRSSGWDRLWDRIRSWGKEARDATLAWEEARMATLHADLQGDLGFIAELESGARSEAEMRALGAVKGLSTAQQAIVEAYFTKPPPRDPLSAVAAGMRVRITEMRKPRLVEQLTDMLYKRPASEWPQLAPVAEAEGGGVSIVKRGEDFFAAVDQWGTDEAKVYRSLGGLTKLQRHVLDLWYQDEHGSTIDAELRDEMEDAELDRAQALMRGDEIAAEAAAIRDAIEGPGTDEEEIYRALRNKTAEERARLEAIYLDRYKTTLADDLKSDLSGEELKRAQALQAGDVRKADAIGLQYAQSSRWYGGPDTDAIQAIYAQNRAEVEDQARTQGWTAAEVHQRVFERHQQIDEAHKAEYTAAGGGPGAGLRASFEANLKGPARDLALGLYDQDWARSDAARLELERRSFITSDKVVNEILESQYTRARKEVTFDAEHDLAVRRELAILRGIPWDEKQQRDAMAKQITTDARSRAEGYMETLKSTYDTAYKYDPLYAVNGRGGFDNLIADHLMGSDKDRALALVKSGGYLNPAQEIKYAVQGPGTDLDVIKRVLADKSPKEIEEIEAQWKELYPNGPSLKDRVMDEVSGRDAFDVGELLQGQPQTPQEKLAAARRKRDYEKNAYALGSKFSKKEAGRLDDEVARLEATVARLERADPASDEAKYYRWKVDQGVKAVDARVEAHRRSVDWMADTMAMVAAITVGLLVTALTFGAAGPVIAGALGALAAAEATILTKIAVKGGAYSQEELLVDVVSGAVDVVFAVATAGVGNALLRVSKGVPIGPLAKLATSASRTKRMIAHGLANSVEGFLGGVPSGAAGALVDEKTWSNGNVLKTVAGAAGMGGLTGAGMGGVIGSGGGWSKAAAHGPHLDPGRPPDLDAAAKAFDQVLPTANIDDQAARAARAGQWHAHQAQHPTASYADFLADLEAGRIAPDPQAAGAFQRVAKQALGSGLPAGDRAVLGDVAVRILGDAEFTHMTGSQSGQAATLVIDGKPVVVMRESAPIAALREEGIHAAQVLDPRLAADVRLLDESRMARWASLDLSTKMQMYRAKLDLELDAHGRLLAGLLDQLDEYPPGPARTALVDQADAARRNMAALAERRAELASFGPLDRLAARFGKGTLAARLEQPPRLFTKGLLARMARHGPSAPAHVDAQRKVVADLRSQIAGIEARARKRGRLTTEEAAHLQVLKNRLSEQYAVVPPEARRAQEAALFDQRPGESLVEYRDRLRRMRGEVEEHVLARENLELWEGYERHLRQVEVDVGVAADLRAQLEAVRARDRANAVAWNENVRAGRFADASERSRLNLDRASLERIDRALRAESARLNARIDALERRGSLLFGDQPWTFVPLIDPADPHIKSRIGLVGELDATSNLIDSGFTPLGGMVDPRGVKTLEAFEATLRKRRGQQDIDLTLKRERPGRTEYALGDSKATAEVSPKAPQGPGRLKTMSTDEDVRQLGLDWLQRHLDDAGLDERDLRNIKAGLADPGEPVRVIHPDGTEDVVVVNRIYAQTFRDRDGATVTRFFQVVGEPPIIGGSYVP